MNRLILLPILLLLLFSNVNSQTLDVTTDFNVEVTDIVVKIGDVTVTPLQPDEIDREELKKTVMALIAQSNYTAEELGFQEEECTEFVELYGGYFDLADTDMYPDAKLLLLHRPEGQPFVPNTVFNEALFSVGIDDFPSNPFNPSLYEFKVVAIIK